MLLITLQFTLQHFDTVGWATEKNFA